MMESFGAWVLHLHGVVSDLAFGVYGNVAKACFVMGIEFKI